MASSPQLADPRSSSLAFPLTRYIERIRYIAPLRGRKRRVDRLPDGRTSLVFRELERRSHGDVTVLGPFTRARLKEAEGFARAVEFQFKPGWSTPLLGVSASELTDEYVGIEELWGHIGHELVHGLLCAQSMPDMAACLSRALATRVAIASEPASAPLARRAAHMLADHTLRVESVAAQLGATSRHLRRAFAENIGVSPKDYARSARLQRALSLASTATSPANNWLRIALDAGYYDQAHLNADFRALVGLTPTALAKRMREPNPQVDHA
ncbi:MAG: AraC family transcriptional regulator [Polyangiales bacterium]